MAGAAMIARDQIRTLQGRTDTHRDRLLTAIRMGAAEHRLALVEFLQLFFECPHQNHLPQHHQSLSRVEHSRLLHFSKEIVAELFYLFLVSWTDRTCQGNGAWRVTLNFLQSDQASNAEFLVAAQARQSDLYTDCFCTGE